MSMASLNISLPQSLKDFVEEQVEQGGYSTPSEFIRELLRENQKRRAEERLEALLLEGLHSGEPVEITPEFWERKRLALLERHGRKKGKR
jgi:antitoxin ParD1/3/4